MIVCCLETDTDTFVWGHKEPRRHKVPLSHDHTPQPPPEWNHREWVRLHCWWDVTGDNNRVAPFRTEHDAGDQDKSSNQQKGEEIEQHQESQQHEEGLDTSAKVPCGVDSLLSINDTWVTRDSCIYLWTASQTHLQSTAMLFSTGKKNRGILWCPLLAYAGVWSSFVSTTPLWKPQAPSFAAPACNGEDSFKTSRYLRQNSRYFLEMREEAR